MNPIGLTLLSNVATQVTGAAQQWQGGVASLVVTGTMGGCTVTLQFYDPASGSWQPVGSTTTVTAAGVVNGIYVPCAAVRAVVSAANPTGLSCSLLASLN